MDIYSGIILRWCLYYIVQDHFVTLTAYQHSHHYVVTLSTSQFTSQIIIFSYDMHYYICIWFQILGKKGIAEKKIQAKEAQYTWSISGKPQDPHSNLQYQIHNHQAVHLSDTLDNHMVVDQATEDALLHTTSCNYSPIE